MHQQMTEHSQNFNDKLKLNCMISSCNFKFSKVNDVIEQAKNNHGADIVEEDLYFETETDFKQYLHQEESLSNTCFIKKREEVLKIKTTATHIS